MSTNGQSQIKIKITEITKNRSIKLFNYYLLTPIYLMDLPGVSSPIY